MQCNHALEPQSEDRHITLAPTDFAAGVHRSRDKEFSRMRRFALLGLLLATAGCAHYADSPFAGFGGFVGDTHTYARNPNLPAGDTDNVRRVLGETATSEPLTPEAGNVWPGPLPPQKTLEDLEKDPNALLKPGDESNLQGPVGSSTPPGSAQPGLTVPPPPAPITQRAPLQSAPRPSTVQTPGGAATLNSTGSVKTYTDPSGKTGIVVPNGNGTSTLIGPDGTVQTVPSPK